MSNPPERPRIHPTVIHGIELVHHTAALAKAWIVSRYDDPVIPKGYVRIGGPRRGPRFHPRKWGFAIAAPDSYDDPTYRVSLYVRLGSPPKGFVLVTNDGARAILGSKTKEFLVGHVCSMGLSLYPRRMGQSIDYPREHRLLKDPVMLQAIDEPETPVPVE